jgi:hypothetical protein
MVGVRIAARAVAAVFSGGANGRATAAARLVAIEVVASGIAPAEAILTAALIVLALHPTAAIVVPVAFFAEVLAGQRFLGAARQQRAERAAENRPESAAAGGGERSGQGIESDSVHFGNHRLLLVSDLSRAQVQVARWLLTLVTCSDAAELYRRPYAQIAG